MKEERPVIAYLGGYCCYMILKEIKCDTCKNNLTFSDNTDIEQNSLIKNLTKGSLGFPKDEITNIVLFEYIIFNKVLQSHEEFLKIHNKKIFLSKISLDYIKSNNTIIKISAMYYL